MQNSRQKRRRLNVIGSDASSSSNQPLQVSCQTLRQLSHRSCLLQSSAGVATSPNANFPSPAEATSTSCEPDVLCGNSLISPQYVDLGSCDEVCEFCGALFWRAERLTSFPATRRPRYHKCCKGGRVVLPFPLQPPELLKNLFHDSNFLPNIRVYNSMFAMTSFGAIVDHSVSQGGGPYVFKVVGQVCHWIGSVCPPPGHQPRFLQMYIYDTQNEVANRLRLFTGEDSSCLSSDIVVALTAMLDEVNAYVRAGDRRYDNPSVSTVGAIVCDSSVGSEDFDVIVRGKDSVPCRVSKLHPSYMPLQYPLLFPYAEQGWSPELRVSSAQSSDDRSLTPLMFYSYQLHDRQGVYNHLLHAGRLFQQYIVDAYICVEHCRLEYIRKNQDEFRSELLEGVHDAIARGDTEGHSVGKRVVLPSSFTGGPRYMYKHYQDALALCRVFGNPQYFITFTCNVKWPEITGELCNR